MKEAHFKDIPSVRKVTQQMKQEGEAYTHIRKLTYLTTLKVYNSLKSSPWIIDLVQSCLKECMTEQENELLKHTLNVLATQGWGMMHPFVTLPCSISPRDFNITSSMMVLTYIAALERESGMRL